MGSKSSRREAPNVKALLQKAGTLTAREVTTKRYTWWTPSMTACSTPFELPGDKELAKQVEKFNNPQETEVERVEDGDSRAR